MRLRWMRCLVLLAVLVLRLASPAAAAAPPPPSASDWLTGQFLVATPDIGDPHFRHAVILIIRHSPDGTLGVIVNRRVEEEPLASLMKALGQPIEGVTGSVALFYGGPVQPWTGLVLHTADYQTAGTLAIDGRVSVTSSTRILRDLAEHHGPQKSLIALGYAGWAPGQLEGELAQHAWYVEPEDPALIFAADPSKVWAEAMARRTVPL